MKDKAGASKKDDKAAKEKEKTAAALAAQREPSGKQPQQQKRSKDTDKVRDAALRGTAGDETAMQELAAHRENVAKAQEKADKVKPQGAGVAQGLWDVCPFVASTQQH